MLTADVATNLAVFDVVEAEDLLDSVEEIVSTVFAVRYVPK